MAVRQVRRTRAAAEDARGDSSGPGISDRAGFVSGLVIVLTPSAARGAALWPVWASLAVALTCAAGAVFGYGLARWAELAVLRPVRVHDVVPIAGLLTVAVLASLTGVVVTVTAHQTASGWGAVRGWALVSVALVGAVPAVAVMYGIRHVADSGPAPGTRGE